MKTCLKNPLVLLLLLAGLAQAARATVAFTVTPAAISNTYSGKITLQVNGLTNTETVVVQKFLDANADGIIDAGDICVQQFNLTDGQAGMVIAGVTNINVPGDLDGAADGAITAKLLVQFANSPLIAGNYLFKLSSPAGHFQPLTNSLAITNFPYPQTFTGTVSSNGVAVPYAGVILFQGSGHDLTPIAGAMANNVGVYTISAPTGTYLLTAFKSQCVASTTAAANLVLGNGATVNTNLNLIATTETLSGQISDASSGVGLPGLLVPVQTQNGLLGICYTDTNGNFTAGVNSNQWHLQSDIAGMAVLGYVGLQNKTTVDTSTGSVANVAIALPKATALFYGTVKDNQGNPLPGVVAIIASDNNNGIYQADGFTDAKGNYVTAALGGLGSNDPWQVQVDNSSSFPNYAFSQPGFVQNGGTNLGVGQAVSANLTAIPATNQITGNVKDSHGNNLAVAGVMATATLNGANFFQYVDTDANGNYSITVADGSWSVSLECSGGSDSLSQLGSYECPNSQSVTIAGNNATNNFIVQPCNGMAITTSSPLPGGAVNSYYSIQFQGASCSGNLNWSVNDPQDLPPGLTLYSAGAFNGTPSNSGTYNFSVNLNDGNGNSTNASFSLTVSASSTGTLQITTSTLPDGIVGGNYNQALSATGGQPGYSWSLTPGSLGLPGGLALYRGGVISGTPTNAPFGGTNYYFSVRVTDGAAATADQLLSLTIYPALTIATNALPGGTLGVAYSAQILVSGGLPYGSGGYSSFLTSGSLPPGLNLSFGATTSSNQFLVISGTPTNSGAFTFTLGAADADSNTVQNDYSITIASSLLISTASLSNAIAGVAYSKQLQGSGGTTPYTWTLANGSQPLPSALTLLTNGLLSGVPAASGTNSFIVRLTDSKSLTVTRPLTLIINPQPRLGSPSRLSSTQFQILLTGVAGQNYTLQMCTNLSATNWASLLTTNSATTNAFMVTDPNATNQQRYYRLLIGP
jgi:hypothetical protein